MKIGYIANASSLHNLKWINHFAKANQVSLFCIPDDYSLIDPSVKIFPLLPQTYPVMNFWKRSRIIKRLQAAIQEQKLDVLHCIYALPHAIWGYKTGFPQQIITSRGSDVLVDYQALKNAKGWRERNSAMHFRTAMEAAFIHARYVTSTSGSQQNVIREMVNNPEKLMLIRTGVDAPRFIEGLKQKEGPMGLTLFHPRYTLPVYRVEFMIKALLKLNDLTTEPFKLQLIDFPKEEYAERIQGLIWRHGLSEHVEWIPFMSTEEMKKRYQTVDMVVMTPSSDGTPVSGIEAMLAKKPLILGNVDYDKDIFNPDTVWQMSSADREAELARIIMEVHDMEATARNSKLKKAQETALDLADLNKEVLKLEQLYQNMLN